MDISASSAIGTVFGKHLALGAYAKSVNKRSGDSCPLVFNSLMGHLKFCGLGFSKNRN